MKNNYKIKTENTKIPDERILRHMNFNKVLTNYKQMTQPLYRKPLYKNPKLFMGLFLAGTIASLVYIATLEESEIMKPSDSSEKSFSSTKEIPHVNPIIEKRPVFSAIEFTPGKNLDWTSPEGIHLKINGDAFCLEGNLPPKGKVEIRFRAFHDAADQISAGIPFNWVAGKKENYLNAISAFEIRAYSGNQQIDFCRDFAAEISLPVSGNSIATKEFPLFSFEETTGNWKQVNSGSVLLKKTTNTWDGFAVIDGNQESISPIGQKPSSYSFNTQFNSTGIFAGGENEMLDLGKGVLLKVKNGETFVIRDAFRISGNNSNRLFQTGENQFTISLKKGEPDSRVLAIMENGNLASGVVTKKEIESGIVVLEIIENKITETEGIRSILRN